MAPDATPSKKNVTIASGNDEKKSNDFFTYNTVAEDYRPELLPIKPTPTQKSPNDSSSYSRPPEMEKENSFLELNRDDYLEGRKIYSFPNQPREKSLFGQR